MKQALSRRIGELEKSAAARVARGIERSPDCDRMLEEIFESVQAWHADPVNQKWVVAQPSGFLAQQVQEFREELLERAHRAGRMAA